MIDDNYTFKEDQTTHELISSHMQVICEEILKTFGKVDSIMLTGGFGRGEGTIRRLPGGKVVPFKDYDIYVVSDSKVSDHERSELLQRIHKRLDISSDWYFSVAPGDFFIDIEAVPIEKLGRLPPDISAVDAKLASRVIYGRDLRDAIPLSSKDTALASGAIVLLNKLTGLLENMSQGYFSRPPTGKRRQALAYECGKTYIEMCTALLILDRRYFPYYRERARIFNDVYAQRFPELRDEIPNLPEKVNYYTDVKLQSRIEEVDDDPVDLWFSTRQDFGTMLRYYMQKFLGVDARASSWSRFADELYKKMGYVFFLEFLDYNLRHFRWYKPMMLPSISFIGQIYDNIIFVSKQFRLKKGIYLHPILHWRSPIIKIFIASLLMLYSIDRDGRIDESLTRRAEHYLKQAYRFDYGHSNSWDNLRSACVEAQKAYYAKTQVIVL